MVWPFQKRHRLSHWLKWAGLGSLVLVVVVIVVNLARPTSLANASTGQPIGPTSLRLADGRLAASVTTHTPVPATPTAVPGPTPTATWLWPIRNQKFVQGYSASHHAWDLSAPAGTAVVAVAAGRVRVAGWDDSGYGNLVVIAHGAEVETWYAHLQYIVVSPGQVVAVGDQVGVEGGTGHAEGWHLHFEVRVAGVSHDPAEFLVRSDSVRN